MSFFSFLSGWNVVRILRLFIGLAALAAAYYEHDKLMGLLGVVFTAQAVFNVGCCGMSACSTGAYRKPGTEEKEIEFETIKKD